MEKEGLEIQKFYSSRMEAFKSYSDRKLYLNNNLK